MISIICVHCVSRVITASRHDRPMNADVILLPVDLHLHPGRYRTITPFDRYRYGDHFLA